MLFRKKPEKVLPEFLVMGIIRFRLNPYKTNVLAPLGVRKKSGKRGDPEETGKSPPDEKVGIIRFDLFVVCVDLFVSRF